MTENPVKTASRTQHVNPFRVMKVLQRARELEESGRKIVHMEVGEPDFVTAQPIIEAARAALASGHTQYSNAAGIAPLREAIADHYQRNGRQVSARRIFVTPGASGGLNLLANLLVEPEAGILMADPTYPCNRNFVRLMGAEAQLVPVRPEEDFQPVPQVLDDCVNPASTGLWLASPANPTGTVINRPALEQLVGWAQQRQLHVLMDEIYQGLHYVESLPSLVDVTQDGFVVNSFSKYFGMTGWRIGWIVVPQDYVEPVDTLAQNLFIAASTISQYAALAAFAPDTIEILEARRESFRQRRDYLYQALQDIGFVIPALPEGAFYLYADVSRFASDSEQFCQAMLEQHGVALTPGTDFGERQAKRYVRFAFTTTMANLELGVERLGRALAG